MAMWPFRLFIRTGVRMARGALLLIMSCSCAYGQVGRRNFYLAIFSNDALTDNELDLAEPQWYRTSKGDLFSVGFALEKTVSKQCSVEPVTGWNHVSRRNGFTRTNFGDLEIFSRCTLYEAAEHELALGAAIDAFFPIGTPLKGGPTRVKLGPDLLWDKGMGDLPASMRYLRPFSLQGESGFLMEVSGANRGTAFTNAALAYSLDYLSRYVHDFGLPPPLRQLVPFLELNYIETVRGNRGRTMPDFRLSPGIAYVNDYFEMAAGTQIALTRAAQNNDEASAVVLVALFLDELVPTIKWTPF
jgi:hypothetical protein